MALLNKILIVWFVLLFSLSLSFIAKAKDDVFASAQIVVLEAPLFAAPDLKARILKYYRKGDRVRLHPQILQRNRFKNLLQLRPIAPSSLNTEEATETVEDSSELEKSVLEAETPFLPEAQLEQLKKTTFTDETRIQKQQDFLEELKSADLQTVRSEFVRTQDPLGREGWFLRKHVYIFYDDEREFEQTPEQLDLTDYRLAEPLPKGYPFRQISGVRGWTTLSLATPRTINFDYNQKVRASGNAYQYEFSTSFLKAYNRDSSNETLTNRHFSGWSLSVKGSSSGYILEERRANEKWVHVGLGRTWSYDPYVGEQDRLTVFSTLLFYPYNSVQIEQSDINKNKDQRHFWGWNLGAKLGALWSFHDIIGDIDFIMGSHAEVNSPYQFRSLKKATYTDWWGGKNRSTFETDFSYSLSGFVGFQSLY